ncbi:MAG: hypothetical protein R3E86_19350 [Pseudomonadales bacterium]
MKALLDLFWQICLLRRTPAHVPTMPWFVAAVIAANLTCSALLSTALNAEIPLLTVLTSIVVGQTTTAGLAWLLLNFSGRADRFLTTITALFGCDLIITACFALLVPVAGLLGAAGNALLLLGFLIWSVAVAGFILHRALEVRLGAGIAIGLGVSLASVMLGQLAIGG